VKLETQFEPAGLAPPGVGARAAWVAAALAFAAIVAVHWRTVADMVAIWHRSETFAHGFLVLPIALWLVWRNRAALAKVAVRPWLPALVGVAGAGVLWLLSDLASVASPAQFAVVFMLQFAILAVLGIEATKTMLFPLAFLLFAVPAGEFLVPLLMDYTADVTILALRGTGVPVYREGNHFMIPTGSWSVVAACSGIRYLIASMMAGSLFAYLTYRTPWKRVAFFAVSVAVPIVANWMRAYLIVMIGHLSGNRYAAGVDHLIYGWVFFGVVIAIMFWIGSFWREDAAATDAAAPVARAPGGEPSTPGTPRRFAVAAVSAAVAAGLWVPVGHWIDASANPAPPGPLVVAPENGWRAVESDAPGWKPRFVGQRAEYGRVFTKDGREVGLYIAYYSHQTQGRELVNSENVLVHGDNRAWKQVGSGAGTLDWAGERIDVKRAELRGGGERLAVAQWYWIGGRYTASDMFAKVLLALGKVGGRDDDSAALVIYTPQGDLPKSSDASLERFSAEMSGAVTRALEQASRR
jgi:exosortase A